MAQLRHSIQAEGVRNPVLVYAFPEGDFLVFGGSRVLACFDVGLYSVPAIVNDHCGRYKDAERVTPENWRAFFEDVPKDFEFTEYGADYHYALERNRRHQFDPAGLKWTEAEGVDPAYLREEFSWLPDYTTGADDE
jgi:hypothetical protein